MSSAPIRLESEPTGAASSTFPLQPRSPLPTLSKSLSTPSPVHERVVLRQLPQSHNGPPRRHQPMRSLSRAQRYIYLITLIDVMLLQH